MVKSVEDKLNTPEAKDLQDAIRKYMYNVLKVPIRSDNKETPKRFVKMLAEETDPESFNFTTFKNEAGGTQVTVDGIKFSSTCEHHLAPFFGTAKVTYIPNDKIVGISKIPRLVHFHARFLQNQERLTAEILQTMVKELDPIYVRVEMTAKHTCMISRGVEEAQAETHTVLEHYRRGEALGSIK